MLCFPSIAATDVSPHEAADIFRLILRAIIVIVFLGMNILYQLFWKKNAKADYFESRGITELPPDRLEPFTPQATDFAPKSSNSYICRCGHDLQSDPHHCLDIVSEDPIRCPKCERSFFHDEALVLAASQAITEPGPIPPSRTPENFVPVDVQQIQETDEVEEGQKSQVHGIEIAEGLSAPTVYQPRAGTLEVEVVGAIP